MTILLLLRAAASGAPRPIALDCHPKLPRATRWRGRFPVRIALFLGLLATASLGPAGAFATTIVALGASQTYGKGVARGDDYPSQLEKLLRASGFEVTVLNAGKNGETTKHMSRRLEKVLTPDTTLVILQPGTNDARKGRADETEDNVARMLQRLEMRGIKTLLIPSEMISPYPKGRDGQHLTPDGYRQLATALLPQVAAVLRKK